MSEKKKNVDFIKDILIEILSNRVNKKTRMETIRNILFRHRNRPGWIRAAMYTNLPTLLTQLIRETHDRPDKYKGRLFRVKKGTYFFESYPDRKRHWEIYDGEVYPDPGDPPEDYAPVQIDEDTVEPIFTGEMSIDNPEYQKHLSRVFEILEGDKTKDPKYIVELIRYTTFELSRYGKMLAEILKQKDKEIREKERQLKSYRIRTCKRCGDSFQAETSQETKCEKCKINSGPN